MNKKHLALLSCSLLLTLVSCGTPENPSSSDVNSQPNSSETSSSATGNTAFTPVEFDTETPVEIVFYSTMGSNLKDVYDAYIEDFYALYPNITVKHEVPGGYDDVLSQIKTELSIGQGPDIAYCYADHVALYNKTKKVVQLDNLIADETYGLTSEQQADFMPGYYEEGRQFGDGMMYTLPFSKSTEVLYYNMDFFEEHNLTVPTTWDEMEAVCARIKEIDPNSIPLGYDSESNLFITMCEQLNSPYTSAAGVDGEHFLFNNETNQGFMKRLKSWYDKGYMTTQEIFGGYTSGLFTDLAENAQRSYMSIGSSAGAKHQCVDKGQDGTYAFRTGIAAIPSYDLNNKKVISQGPSLCMFNQKDPQKVMASWLLMKFLTTNVGFQAQFSIASGYVPVIKSVEQNEYYINHVAKANNTKDFIAATATDFCVKQADNYFTSDAFLGSSEARLQVGSLVQNILTYKGTSDADIDAFIDEAFANAVYQCNYSIGNI